MGAQRARGLRGWRLQRLGHRCEPDVPDGDFDGAASLDGTAKAAKDARGPMSLRWVLVHMIEEYARHLGRADLLRERIYGAVGQ